LIRDDCGFDPERGSLLAYLFGMARNMFLRQLHRVRGDVPLEDESDREDAPELAETPDPLGDLTRKEGLAALRRAVSSLPRRYREVVVLCDLEEVDYADAAVILGCPIGTVRSRLHRAHALLAHKMRQERGVRGVGAALKPVRSLL
jgi:RNA polymerase sigma-70 factor (ECF subfamily)